MSDQAQHLLAAFLQLPESEQESLAIRLLEALPFPEAIWSSDDPGFDAELDCRADDPFDGTPWEQL